MVSLVVPSILLTIARSSPNIKFSKDDFPTFGFPIIEVLIPSFKIFPIEKLDSNFFSFSFTSSKTSFIFLLVVSSISYSG